MSERGERREGKRLKGGGKGRGEEGGVEDGEGERGRREGEEGGVGVFFAHFV